MNYNIMSFNLRFWNEDDQKNAWPYRKEQVAQLILEHDPLIVGIQEGLIEMLEDLDSRLPEYARVGEGRSGGDNSEFSAIYYRADLLKVKKINQIWLSETPDVVGSKSWDSSLCRILTWALFELKKTKTQFLMFNTHLDHVGEVARLKGAELIWERMSSYVERGLPCILTGDFNCFPESQPIRLLRSHLVDAAEAKGKDSSGTFHGFSGIVENGPIDYIFCTPNIQINDMQIIDKQVDGRYPSDHFPIMVNIDL